MSKQLAIIIDCGHDFNTKEQHGSKFSPITGMEEYEFNLATGNHLMALCKLNKIPYKSVSFGNAEREVTLKERTDKANQYSAKYTDYNCVYVSIHANAGGGTGSEVWIHSKSIPSTIKLAESALNGLCTATGQRSRGVKKGYVTNPNLDFHVNRETYMVSMLMECGFMDSKADCYKLLDEKFRYDCALGILKGIGAYYNLDIVESPVETVEKEDKCKKLYEEKTKAYNKLETKYYNLKTAVEEAIEEN